jgi:hypothetical protein
MEELMKKIAFCLIFVGLMLISCATTTGTKITEPVTFAEVVEVENTSPDELFTKVNMWFVDAFRKADSVIQFSDKESGVIKGKYVDDINIYQESGMYKGQYHIHRISSTITVEIREGRYRISFADPMTRIVGDSLNGIYPQLRAEMAVDTQELADKIKAEWVKLAANLKASLNSKSSDW